MPASQTRPRENSGHAASGHHHIQIASSNATANTFLGGRQPSWMTSGGTRKPISRPAVTRPPVLQAVPQQPVQPAVLPSPAPSDEPSPALSSTLDSPSAIPTCLPDAHNMTPAIPSSAALPVIEARFVVGPVIDGSNVQEVLAPGAPAPAPAPITANRASSFGNRVFQPPSNRPQDGQDREIPSFDSAPSPSSAHRSQPSANQGPPDPFLPPFSSGRHYLHLLDQHVRSCGGAEALEPTLLRPRVRLLQEACMNDDFFFIVLHQLFSVWSQTPQDVSSAIPRERFTIDKAFAILETLLKKNRGLPPAHQHWFGWFARFPVVMGSDQWKIGFAAVVDQVSVFLWKLANEYEALSYSTLTRGYPYLVDELRDRLGCYSPVLQLIFFTASRRRLGVPDGNLGDQIEKAFRDDQARQRGETARQQVPSPIAYNGEMEQRNAAVIGFYKQIVAATSRAAPTQQQSGPPPMGSTAPNTQSSPLHHPASVGPSASTEGSFATYHMAPSAQHPVPNPAMQASSHPAMLSHPSTSHHYFNGTVPVVQVGSSSGLQLPSQYQTVGTGGPQLSDAQQHLHIGRRLWAAQAQARSRGPAPQVLLNWNQQQYLQMNSQAMGSRLARTYTLEPQARQGATQQWTYQHFQPAPQMQAMQPMQPMQQIQQVQLMTPLQPARSRIAPRPSQPPRITTAHQTQSDAHQGHRATEDCLFPPPGYILPRPEWPYDASDRKSILMSLHQAHVRSPKRVMRDGGKERFYQAVKSLPLKPTPIVPKNAIYEFRFEVTEEQHALAAARSKQSGFLPVMEHSEGTLCWRARCCTVPSSSGAPTEQEWVTLDINWPHNIYMTLNEVALDVRRHMHNGKDLATEVTSFVVPGTNILKIGLPDPQPDGAQNRFLAVEMVETLGHSSVLNMVWAAGMIPEEETLGIIKQRLTSSSDDEVAFEAPDLSIDLADPFSASIFKVPARGVDCTHMECFDLETWLNTRPSKPTVKCTQSSSQVRCDCKTGPREPSNPDKWRCPICSKDARPYSLRIDSFLLKVRRQLEEEGKLQTKCLRVKADGTWSVVLEEDDNGGESEDDEQQPPTKRAKAGTPATAVPTTTTTRRQQAVEVIEIDDDD